MSKLRTNTISSVSSNSKIYLNSNGKPIINNLKPKIIERDGNDSTQSILTLSNFNEVHIYLGTNPSSDLYIRTGMVTNGLYQVFIQCNVGSPVNTDVSLYPNGITYSNSFIHSYRNIEASTGNFIQNGDNIVYTSSGTVTPSGYRDRFWFDHQYGFFGTTCYEQWIISSGPYNKYVQFEGMDTGPSLSVGYCRWNDTTTTWNWIGSMNWLPSQFTYKRAWVRRIG